MSEQRYGTYTPKKVFKAAIDKIDSLDDDFQFDTDDNDEYKYRTISILNDVCQELYIYSDTCDSEPGKHPICPEISTDNDDIDTAFETALGTDDHINKTLLPDKLAAELLADENPSLANYFQQEYERKLNMLIARGMPCDSPTEVIDVYSYPGVEQYSGNGPTGYYNRGGWW